MDAYDPKYVPAAFGLNNIGVICHFNTLLQGLVSCPSVIKTCLTHKAYLDLTATGKAFGNFVRALSDEKGAKEKPDEKIEGHSLAILRAFMGDLKVRKPSVTFGSRQESADEGLDLLLEMIEPPGHTGEHPLSQLFELVYQYTMFCTQCKTKVMTVRDKCVQFRMTSREQDSARTDREFSESILQGVEYVEDYQCASCAKRVTISKHYQLKRIPEVAVCLFRIHQIDHKHRADGRPRQQRFIPEVFILPGRGEKSLIYRQVAEAEHFGTRDSGHYQARGLRKKGVFLLNDTNVSPAAFSSYGHNENKYLVFYHNCETDTMPAKKTSPTSAPGEVAPRGIMADVVPVELPPMDLDDLYESFSNATISG